MVQSGAKGRMVALARVEEETAAVLASRPTLRTVGTTVVDVGAVEGLLVGMTVG